MKLFGTRVAAKCSLDTANYSGKKLAFIHAGVIFLISLVLTVADLLLQHFVENTSGLDGIGIRSTLQSMQSFLSFAGMVLLPFWQVGFLFACIQYARHQQVAPTMLWEGFRRFGKYLRLTILQALIFTGAIFASTYIVSIICSFTSLSDRVYAVINPLLAQGVTGEELTQQLMENTSLQEQLFNAAKPLYIIIGAVTFIVVIFLFYRMRMATFAIMDDAPGARAAIAASFRMMRKNSFSLFRADLRFWWFYLLKALIFAVALGSQFLNLLGISLPVDSSIMSFVFYMAYLLLELLLNSQCGAYIQTTYAHCYQMLKDTMPRPDKMIEQ